jgi:hypothetical protein
MTHLLSSPICAPWSHHMMNLSEPILPGEPAMYTFRLVLLEYTLSIACLSPPWYLCNAWLLLHSLSFRFVVLFWNPQFQKKMRPSPQTHTTTSWEIVGFNNIILTSISLQYADKEKYISACFSILLKKEVARVSAKIKTGRYIFYRSNLEPANVQVIFHYDFLFFILSPSFFMWNKKWRFKSKHMDIIWCGRNFVL